MPTAQYFSGHGYNPFACPTVRGVEVAGVEASHNAKDVLQTLLFHNSPGDVHVHHCVLEDLAAERETKPGKGVDSIRIENAAGAKSIHHNLIRSSRQYGVTIMNGEVFCNEIYVADPGLASPGQPRAGIREEWGSKPEDLKVHDNRIFCAPGTGERGK